MNRDDLRPSFVIGGPHYVVGFYFENANSNAQLMSVCEKVLAAQPLRPVAALVAKCRDFPIYGGFMYGLPAPVEAIELPSLDKQLTNDQHLLEVSLHSTTLGPVVVGYETIAPQLAGLVAHPIGVTIRGKYLELVSVASADEDMVRRSQAEATFLLDTLRICCETLAPLYGIIIVEEPMPTPADLIGSSRCHGEVFFSEKLLNAQDGLRDVLDHAYAQGYSEAWATGRFYSSWAPFNPAGRTMRAPLSADTAARRAIRAAVRNLFPTLTTPDS
jgi:hypothetical protein